MGPGPVDVASPRRFVWRKRKHLLTHSRTDTTLHTHPWSGSRLQATCRGFLGFLGKRTMAFQTCLPEAAWSLGWSHSVITENENEATHASLLVW